MSALKIRFVVMALICQGAMGSAHSAEFRDPLERQAPAIGGLAAQARLTAVAAAASRLVAVGPRGLVLLSDDAGRTWRQTAVPLSSDLVAVRFRTEEDGWATGHDGVVLHSADGGVTWSKQLDGLQAADTVRHYYHLDGADEGRLNASQRDDLRRFADEGADKPAMDVLFLSSTEGFVVGAYNLAMRTLDGGATWTPLMDRTGNPESLHLYGLAVAGGKLYMAGERGLLRRWNPVTQGFEAIDSPYPGSFFGLIGKGDTLIAFGLQGNAFRTRDGGKSWDKLQGLGNASITAGAVLTDGSIALVSQAGRVLVSGDDGDSFSEQAGSWPMPYSGVASAGSGAVAVVGATGAETIVLKGSP